MANLQAQIDGLTARSPRHARGRWSHGRRSPNRSRLIDLLLLRGHVLGRIADYERAAGLAEQLVRDAPDDGTAWLARARTRATFHRFAEALADLDAAERRGADRAALDAERAAIFQALGCYDDALALRRDAAERRPDFATLGALAGLQAERGEVAEAERLFAEARRHYRDVSPFPVAVLDFQRGLMWLGRGHLRTARVWFDAALRRVPAYAPALGHLAEVDAALGAREAAIDRLRPLTVSSDDPDYAATLAGVLSERGRPQEAAPVARQGGGALRRTGGAPSGGLRRSRGGVLAHRGRRPIERTSAPGTGSCEPPHHHGSDPLDHAARAD